MLITLNIQAETPQELQQAIAGLALSSGAAAPAPAKTDKDTAAKSTRSTATKPQETVKEADPAKEDATEPDPEATDAEYIPTVVELRELAGKVGTTPDGKKAVKALLEKYSSPSLSNVPEDERAAFLADLKKIAV